MPPHTSACRRLLATLAVLLLATGTALAAGGRRPGDAVHVLDGVRQYDLTGDSCGAGSLASVMAYYGTDAAIDEIDALLPKSQDGGVLSIDLLLAARRLGFEARWVDGDPSHLTDLILAGMPAILMLQVLNAPGGRTDLFHYVVVDGVDPDRELFRFASGDSLDGWGRFGRRLQRAWDGAGHAMLVIRPQPADPEELLKKAFALELAGYLDEAAASYRQLVEREPGLYRGWVNLGNVETRLLRYAVAEAAYRKALDLAPDQPDALNNLAWILLERQGHLDEAEELARRAADQGGAQLPFVLDTLGRILLARERCGEAAGTFRRALHRIEPEALALRVALLQGLADSHRGCGDLRGAQGFLEQALAIESDPRSTALILEDLASLHAARRATQR